MSLQTDAKHAVSPTVAAPRATGTAAYSIDDCRLIDLPKIGDPRGNLTFIEGGVHVPFAIERVYYLYDVPGGAERGGHAHRALHQLIVAMSGSDFAVKRARSSASVRDCSYV